MATSPKPEAMPRGLRNNNPLNIRRGQSNWIGARPKEFMLDMKFCEFQTMAFGFRAAFRILNNYYRLYHMTTLERIIERWAPAKDGNTPRHYAEQVARRVSETCDQRLRIGDQLPSLRPCDSSELHRHEARALWIAIVLAMAEVENGAEACARCRNFRQEAEKGYRMAFVYD